VVIVAWALPGRRAGAAGSFEGAGPRGPAPLSFWRPPTALPAGRCGRGIAAGSVAGWISGAGDAARGGGAAW